MWWKQKKKFIYDILIALLWEGPIWVLRDTRVTFLKDATRVKLLSSYNSNSKICQSTICQMHPSATRLKFLWSLINSMWSDYLSCPLYTSTKRMIRLVYLFPNRITCVMPRLELLFVLQKGQILLWLKFYVDLDPAFCLSIISGKPELFL